MKDTTTGSGDERHSAGRLTRPPHDEWAPGDPAPGDGGPRDPRPEERLPGEPAPDASPAGTTAGRLSGSAGPGRDGLTADDRAPDRAAARRTPDPDTAAAPPASGTHAPPHGDEGLRPGTERLGPDTSTSGRPGGSFAGPDAPVERDSRTPDDGLGLPSSSEATGREAGPTGSRAADTRPAAPGSQAGPGDAAHAGSGGVGETGTAPSGVGAPLLAHDEADRWEQRIRQVLAGFVEEPRTAVEEADRALEEIAARFSEAVTRRRRTLRTSWQGTEERGHPAEADTEQLRLALRDYRELAGRLLHV